MLNDEDDQGRLIPHPTAIVLDRKGRIRYVRVDTDYRVRPPTEELVGVLQRLEAEAG